MLQIFRSVVDDPVARAAPAPADIIEPPELHRRPELESANNNPLKRKGDVDQQPYSRLEPVGLRQSSLESASASRARVWAESQVNVAPSASCCDRVVAKLTPYLRAARPPVQRLLAARW
jgi:hypothetical protein